MFLIVPDLYNLSALTPSTQTVGQPLILECTLTAVRGITSRVDMVWSINGLEIYITEGVNVTITNAHSATYRVFYTIPLLSTTDDGRVYQCEAVINTSPPVVAIGNVTLDVTGVFVVICKT